jgi:DNA-directed RNA polymerase subunit beta'
MKKLKSNERIIANEVVNKKKIKELMYLTLHNYGIVKSALIADRLKNLTFHYATKSGISLNAEDLKVPFRKRNLISLTKNEIQITEYKCDVGVLTSVERFQKVIDIWNNTSKTLKEDILTYFRESDPLNPLYIMAFSGARGNISQVRQLIGMRGLMADPQGQIIELPIQSNFREGLTVTEYIISSYGARKGLVDTALRTADSGYLTRRLVDVAQDIIVREEDCFTKEGLIYESTGNETRDTLKHLVGRVLLHNIYNNEKKLIGRKNEDINFSLIKRIEKNSIDCFEFRSPLTCDSNRSVCSKCYGWHLSYSRIIDLGEAVGIIAAQSIGEPGTQLTMRTFHTGGVFLGDLTKQICSPIIGTVFYTISSNTPLVRTINGEKGFKLTEDVVIFIENNKNTTVSLNISSGNILLVNNKQKIYCGQIIAEITKDTNIVLEEDRKNIYAETVGEIFFHNIKFNNVLNKQRDLDKISTTSGLFWILNSGQYKISNLTKINIPSGSKISSGVQLAFRQLTNQFTGVLRYNWSSSFKGLNVLISAMLFKATTFKRTQNKNLSFRVKGTDPSKHFLVTMKENELLENGQPIAFLLERQYNTEVGGTVYYNLDKTNFSKKNQATRKSFQGVLYWVPEETHSDKFLSVETLRVKPNSFIKKGDEIWDGVNSKISGLVQFDILKQSLTVKPGELFVLDDINKNNTIEDNIFVKPGTLILNKILAQKLVYLELIEINKTKYIFLRPVFTYKVSPDKGFKLEFSFFPRLLYRYVTIRTVKRIFLKHGEKNKSTAKTRLIQTSLVISFNNNHKLNPRFIYFQSNQNLPAISFSEELQTAHTLEESKIITPVISYTTHANQFLYPKTGLAKIRLIANITGTFLGVKVDQSIKNLLILKQQDLKIISYDSKMGKLNVQVGDLIRKGTTLILNQLYSPYSGQVYAISSDSISIRVGKPYLISKGTILRVENKSLVSRSDLLATLVYEKIKTVDIVQGLPKVEEILEARKIKNGCLLAPCPGKAYLKKLQIEIIGVNGSKMAVGIESKSKPTFFNGNFVGLGEPLTDGPINPHQFLMVLFNYHYYSEKRDVGTACKKSFKQLQLFLVNEIQRTYKAQNVQIADKHVEVIIKQMTSRVKIEENEGTTLLPGEILKLNQALTLTKVSRSIGQATPFYTPVLLGVTKVSLNSDSFISAASFQETTRILTEAALEGKKDWLNGLKENVILGRLIPAGTGFNSSENLNQCQKASLDKKLFNKKNNETVKKYILNYRINNSV